MIAEGSTAPDGLDSGVVDFALYPQPGDMVEVTQPGGRRDVVTFDGMPAFDSCPSAA